MLLNAEQVKDLIRRNIDALINTDYISAYIIGSLASGDYVEGRSDCDIVVVTSKVLDREVEFIYDGNHFRVVESDSKTNLTIYDIKITIYYRPYMSIVYPIKQLLEYDAEQLVSGKELSCVEDSLLIADRGILVAGRDIKDEICLPSSLQFGCYLKLIERISTPIENNDVVRLMVLAKNIMLYAKHFYYMWTQKCIYSSNIIDAIEKGFPAFSGILIMKQAHRITQMNWFRCRLYLIKNPEILGYIDAAYDRFIASCNAMNESITGMPMLVGMKGRGIELQARIYRIKQILMDNQDIYEGLI